MKTRKQTKSTMVLDSLRQDIITGRLKPGQKLQMEDLKLHYQVGYSPLREALSRLVSHGLVQVEEQCGFTVAPLSVEELYDLYFVRTQIELQTLELSMMNGDDTWEADIISTWYKYKKFLSKADGHEFNSTTWDVLQKDFRFSLIKACQSPWLLKIREMLNDQALRYRFVCLSTYYQDSNVLSAFIKENDNLVSAVLARDTMKAMKLTKSSWESSVKLIAEAMTNKSKDNM